MPKIPQTPKENSNANFLFASIFTLAKDDVLHQFERENFDYIIVDEVHHAGTQSYKKVIDYFKPKFLLGLTATPKSTDGFAIFSMFDNNIPYEIRLQKALEEDLLCPFHYYGLSDLTVNNMGSPALRAFGLFGITLRNVPAVCPPHIIPTALGQNKKAGT